MTEILTVSIDKDGTMECRLVDVEHLAAAAFEAAVDAMLKQYSKRAPLLMLFAISRVLSQYSEGDKTPGERVLLNGGKADDDDDD